LEWLREYFKAFSGKSISGDDMKSYFQARFPNIPVDWDAWFYGTGLPSFDPRPHLDHSLFKSCEELAERWKNGGKDTSADDIKSWGAYQKMAFQDLLLNTAMPLPHEVIAKMDQLYGLSKATNVEIEFRWLMIALNSNYVEEPILEELKRFLSRHGRGIYIRPLYRKLHALSEGDTPLKREFVAKLYHSNRPFYHSVIRNTFDGCFKI
jgi:leukotriene-A4 hydrolase